MARPTIPDKDIPNADPEQLIYCFTPWVWKIVNHYVPILDRFAAVDKDDLFQSGIIGLLKAAKKYDPEGGSSFLGYSRFWISCMIRRCLGLDKGLPPVMVPLDKPLTDDADDSLLDTIPDPTILPFDKPIIEQEERTETAKAISAALDRMKSNKQREVIRRVYLDGQGREEAAADMGINYKALCALDSHGKSSLRRDKALREYAMPFFHVGVDRFRTTWLSAVEEAVIWREKHLFHTEATS